MNTLAVPDEATFTLEVIVTPGSRSQVRIVMPKRDSATDSDKPEKAASQSTKATQSVDAEVARRFRRLSDDWTSVAIGFFDTVPLMSALNFLIAEGDFSERVIDYAKEKAISQTEAPGEDGQKVMEFNLSTSEMPVIARKLGKSTQSLKAAGSLGRAALAALISEYEAFLGELLRVVAIVKPGAFVSDEDQISLKEIQTFSSIDQVKESMLETKIEDLLHDKSHTEVLKWICDKFGVNLLSDEKMIAEFVEACQRRHLLMHGAGKVNKRYLRICESAGFPGEKLPLLGEVLEIDRKYLRRATSRVFLVGFFTLQILWQKLCPKQTVNSVQAILESSHDFIESDLTKTCRRVCDFAIGSKTKMNERHNAYFIINRAQSFLFDSGISEDERSEGVKGSLRMRDWSMASPTVSLALACLNRDTSKLAQLTKAAIAEGLTYHSAQMWSIFREVRENPDFIGQFRNS